MTKEVVTAATEDEVAALARRMAQEQISCVVIMGGRKPVGIVSERDIVRVVAERPALIVGMKAREMMSSPVVTLTASTPVAEARRQMIERGTLFGEPGYRWIGARTKLRAEYWAAIFQADSIPETLEQFEALAG